MSKKFATDEKLRRLGQTAYKEIVVPRRRTPVPSRLEPRSARDTAKIEGFEFARERLSPRDAKVIGARSKQPSFQHIVAAKEDDPDPKGRLQHPWRYRVLARCKAKLRRAAIKSGRQFLELDLCPKCRKTLPAEGDVRIDVTV